MEFDHPSWSNNTNIYEVNVRQYTPEGTFQAFEKHLPRLKDMGIEILWFMPITPISNKDRKGTLGSYYAVQNYTDVNPEFGTLKDFIDLVKYAHHLCFKIIIDWVANHTGNDNVWIKEHPDFFCYNEESQIIHPNGWEDVSKLNYENLQMQVAMIDAMKFWVDTCDIDGFRCDMAHLVPLGFWKKAIRELKRTKAGLFWLAECEEANYHEVFDATYTWKWMHKNEMFCKKQADLKSLEELLMEYDLLFYKNAYRVYFTSNHDENSWNGTEYEKYGDAAKAFAVFSCTWNGIPMIYSGQELPNYKRLQFFDKDQIEWKQECDLHSFYKTLLHLRKTNAALRAGDKKVITHILSDEDENEIFAFLRNNNNDEVIIILNLSPENTACNIINELLKGRYRDVFTGEDLVLNKEVDIQMKPWDYLVLEKEK
ncbi:MAG TPA: alpha-amylase family glycosyl hydrolase [Chitinophagaceae bacterium]|nr:alpha-amylase family glycosyl hydrolase [Chitinophagaceae bacterium]